MRQLCLVYRAEVSEPGQDYNFLAAFHDRLIPLVPADIEGVVLVKSRQVAAGLHQAALHPREPEAGCRLSPARGIPFRVRAAPRSTRRCLTKWQNSLHALPSHCYYA